jgi:hypothetical protein
MLLCFFGACTQLATDPYVPADSELTAIVDPADVLRGAKAWEQQPARSVARLEANMKYAIVLSLVLIGSAHAQDTQLTGPNAAPRVPEAASDVPVKAPGPTTGNPTAAGPSTGAVEPTKPVTSPEANKANTVIAPSGPTGARPSNDTK